MIKVIRAKLHGIKVTNADLDYHGSITLDPEHCELVGIYPLEFVEIWNKSSGARISTYVIFGAAGSRCCILNGAAARTCQIGDQLIIAASEYIDRATLCDFDPTVLTFHPDNTVDEQLQYRVRTTAAAAYELSVVSRPMGCSLNGESAAAQRELASPVEQMINYQTIDRRLACELMKSDRRPADWPGGGGSCNRRRGRRY